jgi:hypothetical protein
MAEELIRFDLFTLMVEYVAGSIALSLIIWGIILLITCIMGRMSMKSIAILMTTYFAAASVGYIGALAAVPLFIVASFYMTINLLNWINSMR